MRPEGLIPATVTPFDEAGDIAYAALERHVSTVAEHEVFGVAVNGHAGEVLSLTSDERVEVIRAARSCLPNGRVLIAGIEGTSTRELVAEAQRAASAGADGLLVLPPFDARPLRHLTKEVAPVERLFRALDQAVGLPMIVFQYPATSGVDYSLDVLEALSEIPSVVGIKAGTGDITRYVAIHDRLEDRVAVLAASDAPPLLSMLLHGATGALIGISVLGTEIWADLVTAALSGQSEQAIKVFKDRCLPLTTALFENQQPETPTNAFACTKEAMVMLGLLDSAMVREPIVVPDDQRKADIRNALVSAGLLQG